MTEKQIKKGIDVSQCECYLVKDDSCNDTLSGSCMKEKCQIFRLLQTIKAKEQEYEELRQYHNKCCEENVKKLEEWLEKYNQFSKDFFIGKYCKKEYCELLKAKEQECEELKESLKVWKYSDVQHIFKINKYEQTLAEIKEIAEKAAKCLYVTKSDDYTDGYRWLGSIILQKISECEGRE